MRAQWRFHTARVRSQHLQRLIWPKDISVRHLSKQLRIKLRKGRQLTILPRFEARWSRSAIHLQLSKTTGANKTPAADAAEVAGWSKALGANRSYPTGLLTAGEPGRANEKTAICRYTYRCFLASTGFSGDPSPDPGEPMGFPFVAVPTPTPGPLTAPVSLEGFVLLPVVAASLAV